MVWFSEDAIGQICMVTSEGKAAFDTDIIIDSGADVSVLPLSMSACGSDAPQKQERYVDAQGKELWNDKTTVMASHKRHSFCVTGEIRAVHEDVCHGNCIQVTLLPVLSKVKTGVPFEQERLGSASTWYAVHRCCSMFA